MLNITSNGIQYSEDLVSIDGVAVILFPTKKTSKENIAKAKREIRNKTDVVRMRVANEDDWDYQYKSEIFRHPATRPLEWYEIEQDEEIIRSEREKGTSVNDFVEKIVLPNVEKTRAKYLAKYGDKIYKI